jgi:hypothetical protein
MKHKWILIVFLLLFSCKSPKQNEENLLIEKEVTPTEQNVAEEFIKQEKETRSETQSENPEDTLTYLEILELREEEKEKRDSFLAQFNKHNIYCDTLVSVIGIVQNSGVRKSFNIDIKPEYQLTNPIKSIFLVTDKELNNFWGKCVRVTGHYLNNWNYESDYFGRTAINLESIETVSSNYCLNSPIFASASEKKYRYHANDTVVECFIHRTKRPSPDIGYDYGIELTKPIEIISEGWTGFKSIPVNININLDTLNFIIETKKKVKLFGNLTGGNAEMIVFDCKEYKGIIK